MDTTVIMSSYNQPKSMALGLYALTLQDDLDFELIVADDGSGPEVGDMVADFAKTAPFPVRFITQDDDGFRKPTILNKAASIANGNKLIFLDGDCIPLQKHVSQHVAGLDKGSFCVGGCVFVPPGDTLGLTSDDIKNGRLSEFITPEALAPLKKKHRASIWQPLFGSKAYPRIFGCNLSVKRDVFFTVNGYDESFNGLGKEDSDLRNRLRNNDFKGVSLLVKNIVCHLDHALDRKSHTVANKRAPDKKYYESRKKALTAAKGLKELACLKD